MTKKLIVLFFILIFQQVSNSQNSKIDSLESLLKYSVLDTIKIKILLELTIELNKFDPQKALNVIDNSIVISKEGGYEEFIVKSLTQKAIIYQRLGRFKEVIEVIRDAKFLSKKIENRKSLANLYYLESINYVVLDDLEKAYDLQINSLNIYRSIGDSLGIIKIYNGLGNLLLLQKNLDESIKYYLKVLKYRLVKDTINLPFIYNNLANVYKYNGNYEESLKYYFRAVYINKKIGDTYSLGMNFINIGENYIAINDTVEARVYLYKALSIFEKFDNYYLISKCYTLLAKTFLNKNELERAKFYASKILELFNKLNSPLIKIDLYDINENISLIENDYIDAVKLLDLKRDLSDSIQKIKNKENIEFELLRYEIEVEKNEDYIKTQSEYINRLFIVFILLFIGVLILLVIWYLNIKKNRIIQQKILAQDDLRVKNKELLMLSLPELKKKTLLDEVIYIINSIILKQRDKKENVKIEEFKRRLVAVKEQIVTEKFLIEYCKEFNDRLIIKFPDLTNNEIELCMMLRLNMSNKEITEITGKTSNTLAMAKYRLRKKLNLNKSKVSLNSFLSRI